MGIGFVFFNSFALSHYCAYVVCIHVLRWLLILAFDHSLMKIALVVALIWNHIFAGVSVLTLL